MKKLTIAALLMATSTVALADSVIVTDTVKWTPVPITVDADHVYTVNGTLPVDGDYYYSYSGYRCFNSARTNAGVEAVIYKPKGGTGATIYCYPEM
ncbi:MAG: hypothetical protein H0U73_08860 [Tatlockia sp.]|nr:hypothetical protein [Tatlockia sp.]